LAVSSVSAQSLPGNDAWRTDFSKRAVDLAEIVPGGPSKDGIPPIDRPRFIRISEATWLAPREPVLVVGSGARTKIYPLQILIWHEIVNDVVGAQPVAVTYCPLCNTALVFDRRVGGTLLDFGTTGRLRHSDLVMYDRQTESWWQQATGEAIVGEMTGRRLAHVEAQMVAWRDARARHPDALVLSRETGFQRPYGRNPYVRYDGDGKGPIAAFFARKPDARLPPMERVVTIDRTGTSVAYPFGRLRQTRVINDTVASHPIVVFWVAGTASAVDAADFGQGRDVGSAGVFDRRLGSQTLVFEPVGHDAFRDTMSGTTWNHQGLAIAGPHKGKQLQPVAHGNHFWFAWAAFRPDTRLAAK
jgi:hypothetical protein